jgi:hypothetical protein
MEGVAKKTAESSSQPQAKAVIDGYKAKANEKMTSL